MARSDKEFLIKVRADIRQSVQALQGLTAEIARGGQAAATAARQQSAMGRGINQLKTAAAAYLSLRTVQALIQQADAFNVLQARIRAATKESGDYALVSDELFRTSQRNGVALETTVALFQSLARSAPELQATREQVIRITDSVQKLGVISGATNAAMSAGLLQFSQGLAAGVFRAEEFNSILENVPEIAVRIAKGMGTSVTQLRALVLEGKLLSRDVFQALLSQTEEINQDFEAMPVSVARAGTQLANSFQRMIANLDQAYGITNLLAKTMQLAAEAADAIAESVSEENTLLREAARLQRQRQQAIGDRYFGPGGNFGLGGTIKAVQDIDRELEAVYQRLAEIRGLFPSSLEGFQEWIEPSDNLDEVIAQMERWERVTERLQSIPATPSEESKAQARRIEETVRALEIEAVTYGKTAGEITLYKLALDDASQAQLQRARAALEAIEAEERFEAAVRASEEAVLAENAAYHDWLQSLQDEGQRVYEETRTAQERLANELERYQLLLREAAIDQETYNRAVAQAKERFDELEKDGKQTFDSLESAIHGWGREFTDTLTDMVTQGKGSFKDLADSIIRDLIRIQIQEKITKPILEAGTGLLRTIIPFAAGGPVIGPGTATSDSIPARLSAGEYVVRASAVKAYGADFLEAINQMRLPRFAGVPPMRISTPGQHFATGGLATAVPQAAAQPVRVELINKGQPQKVSEAQGSFDPSGMVLRIVTEDLQRGGPLSGAFQRTFNLRRSGR